MLGGHAHVLGGAQGEGWGRYLMVDMVDGALIGKGYVLSLSSLAQTGGVDVHRNRFAQDLQQNHGTAFCFGGLVNGFKAGKRTFSHDNVLAFREHRFHQDDFVHESVSGQSVARPPWLDGRQI
jgi:hypothetical protein